MSSRVRGDARGLGLGSSAMLEPQEFKERQPAHGRCTHCWRCLSASLKSPRALPPFAETTHTPWPGCMRDPMTSEEAARIAAPQAATYTASAHREGLGTRRLGGR